MIDQEKKLKSLIRKIILKESINEISPVAPDITDIEESEQIVNLIYKNHHEFVRSLSKKQTFERKANRSIKFR